jgi:hypothetical protein
MSTLVPVPSPRSRTDPRNTPSPKLSPEQVQSTMTRPKNREDRDRRLRLGQPQNAAMEPGLGGREDGWRKLYRLSWDDARRCEHGLFGPGPNEFWSPENGRNPPLTCMRARLRGGVRIGVLARVWAMRSRVGDAAENLTGRGTGE